MFDSAWRGDVRTKMSVRVARGFPVPINLAVVVKQGTGCRVKGVEPLDPRDRQCAKHHRWGRSVPPVRGVQAKAFPPV